MTEYVKNERTTDIGDAYTRFEWKSVDDFEKYIRSIAPKGKIIGIYGRGYMGDGGDLEPRPPLQLIVTAQRPKAVVDREQAKAAERARIAQETAQERAEEAARKAARQKAREAEANLMLQLERAEQRLSDKQAEIESFHLENPDVPRGGNDDS